MSQGRLVDQTQLQIVRRIKSEDLDQVIRLERRTFADPYTPSLLRLLAETYGNTFFVAESDGKIIGYSVGLMENPDSGHVLSLAVAKDHQMKGIGKLLTCALIAELKTLGAKRAILEVRASNLTAQKFYSALGFTRTGEVRFYYPNREDALQYELSFGG